MSSHEEVKAEEHVREAGHVRRAVVRRALGRADPVLDVACESDHDSPNEHLDHHGDEADRQTVS